MNSQERDVIAGIFQRLEQASSQPRDAEAERFIADRLRAQPYAPYAMAQLVYVQEEAIKSLNQQLEQARAEAQQAPQQGASSGGFLSSIFGGGSRQEPQPQARPGGPWGAPGGYGQQPQQGYGQPPQGQGFGGGYAQQQPMGPQGRGSGFLGSALTTAAGVAGGMVVGSALMNAFSGGHSALGSLASTGGETVNNFFGSDAAGASSADFGAPLGGADDASVQNASYDDGGFDGGLDDGGNDDWV